MSAASKKLRQLMAADGLIYLPSAYDGLGARLVQSLGFPAVYNGGFVTGGAKAVSEPLVTMDEQVRFSSDIANAVTIPLIADAGAGFGEPLHTMRTVREFIRGGVAGIHIEDQLYPKRAHFHKDVTHAVPRDEYIAKIKYACLERDRTDPDFVIIARTETLRLEGFDEALTRINLAADAGADAGMVFVRNEEEAARATKQSKIPLVYLQSYGNRDGRPLLTQARIQELGFKFCIEPIMYMLVAYKYAKQALIEMRDNGIVTLLSKDECIEAKKAIETLAGLEEFYEVESQTVE